MAILSLTFILFVQWIKVNGGQAHVHWPRPAFKSFQPLAGQRLRALVAGTILSALGTRRRRTAAQRSVRAVARAHRQHGKPGTAHAGTIPAAPPDGSVARVAVDQDAAREGEGAAGAAKRARRAAAGGAAGARQEGQGRAVHGVARPPTAPRDPQHGHGDAALRRGAAGASARGRRRRPRRAPAPQGAPRREGARAGGAPPVPGRGGGPRPHRRRAQG